MKQYVSSLAVVLCLAAFQGCSEKEAVSAVEKIRPAKLITVKAASAARKLTFPAIIQASRSTELTFQIAGEISELHVLEGDRVQRGDVIAQLNQRDASNRLAQAQAEFDNAEAEYQRAERLFAQDAISRSVLDSRRTQREVVRVSLATSVKALDDTILKAPFTGAVARVMARQYQNVQAKELIAILQSREVEAVMSAPGTIIARAHQMKDVRTHVVLDAAPDQPILAQFKEASVEADQSTQTYSISFSFLPPEGLLILPGMTATIESDFLLENATGTMTDGVAVPLASILAEGERRYVWVVAEGGVLRKQPVSLEGNPGEVVTVVDGLNGDETIVGAGVGFFHEGMKVRAWSPE